MAPCVLAVSHLPASPSSASSLHAGRVTSLRSYTARLVQLWMKLTPACCPSGVNVAISALWNMPSAGSAMESGLLLIHGRPLFEGFEGNLNVPKGRGIGAAGHVNLLLNLNRDHLVHRDRNCHLSGGADTEGIGAGVAGVFAHPVDFHVEVVNLPVDGAGERRGRDVELDLLGVGVVSRIC